MKAWDSSDEAALGRLPEHVYPELRRMAGRYLRDGFHRKQDERPAKVNLDDSVVVSPSPDRSILTVNETLTVFSQVGLHVAKVVELRHLGGMTGAEIIATLRRGQPV